MTNPSDPNIIPIFTMAGNPVSRVTNDSKNPANMKSGVLPMMILMARLVDNCNEVDRLYVPGKSKPLPSTYPAAPAMIMAEISMVPCIQIVKNEVIKSPF